MIQDFKLCNCRAWKEHRMENHNYNCAVSIFREWLDKIYGQESLISKPKKIKNKG
jgi:hypothetical protein